MKAKYLFLALFAIAITNSCMSPTEKTERHVNDSIAKVREDSIHDSFIEEVRINKEQDIAIEKAREEKKKAELAYASRPWNTEFFVDDFGDTTNVKFISSNIIGYYTNSAVSNENLYVEIIVTKIKCGFFLHERNLSSPSRKFIGAGTIILKNAAGSELTIYSHSSWNQKGGLLLANGSSEKNNYKSQFTNFLKKSDGKIRCIVKDEYAGSTYKFSIDPTGFAAEYNNL